MVEALALIHLVLGIVHVAGTLGHKIHNYARHAREIDQSLEVFASELQLLCASLRSVETGLKAPHFLRSLSQTRLAEESWHRLEFLQGVLQDCEKTLTDLAVVLDTIQRRNYTRFLPQGPAATMKLQYNMPALTSLRNQLKSYQSIIQIELQVIDLQILATTSATVERINYSVTSIKKDISKSRFGIGRKQNNSESDAIAYIDDDVKADNFIGYFSSAENAVKDLEKYAPTTSMTGVFTVNSSVLGDDKEDGKTETVTPSSASIANEAGDLNNKSAWNSQTPPEEHLAKGHYEKALEISKNFVKLSAEANIPRLPDELARATITQALAHASLGRFKRARGLLLTLKEKSPAYHLKLDVIRFLAEMDLCVGDSSSARENALEAMPGDASVFGTQSVEYVHSNYILMRALELLDQKEQIHYCTRKFSTISLNAGMNSPPTEIISDVLGARNLMVASRTNPNACNDLGITLLMYAAGWGLLDTVTRLLDPSKNSGAVSDVNACCINGQTALHRACSAGEVQVVEELITHGADVNSPGKTSWTPLVHAVTFGQTAVVKTLLANDADPKTVEPWMVDKWPEISALLKPPPEHQDGNKSKTRSLWRNRS